MDIEELRISKLREYLFDVIDTIITNKKYQINANMLSDKIENYSLDKIPVDVERESWIIGVTINRDVYSFRSRMAYSEDVINNLWNIGFFEHFENIIKSNDENGILPDIENIEGIKCLNCGTLKDANTNTAEFDIQIEVRFRR